ncbi:DNA-binding protein [Streptomyces sp. NPDC005012]|uniref:DNA-binding protein n=1 Tax=Streptomyces sp. NPDC005012 TaxID=3154558 RepID=UPI0033BD0F5F
MNDPMTRNAAPADPEELLRAGAVLPPGTAGAGDRAVPMFTQAYRHPGLDGRIVVRLTAAEQSEGARTGFLGLEPDGEPVEVGLGRPRALGFPEWVLVRHPSDGHLAMSLIDEMNKVARKAKSSPKRARAAYESIGERLAASVPHFLPTFYEQAGRVFLAADEKTYASLMFVNARKAETAHGLPFDEARMDAVFLEFSLADAVPTKVLSSYAKGLSSRVPVETAFRHLRGLFVRLAAHGLPPSSPAAADLRRLAKAVAGRNALAEEVAYLREMLVLPGTVKAPLGWWKAHRAALLELTRREPAVRGTLLGLMPAEWEGAELSQWLDLLEKSGATAGLCDSTLPADVRSPDGTAGWMRRFLQLCRADRHQLAPAELYPLVDRMADTLRTELDATGDTLPPPVGDVDLLDQLLSLRVPLAEPQEHHRLGLDAWAAREGRRDLAALEADTRFRPAFRRGCPEDDSAHHRETLLALAGSPGGRPMLAEWVGEVGRTYIAAELPGFTNHPRALRTLSWLPGEVLAVAEKAVREALATGVAPALARALRTGILDELGWPAWEEAVGSRERAGSVHIADAWPYLVVLVGTQVRVIGAEGTVLTHELCLPPDVAGRPHRVDCQYVDGELFVRWYSSSASGWQGYWHRSADAPPIQVENSEHSGVRELGARDGSVEGMSPVSLPLPGGGRTTGHGVLRRGDTVVPQRRLVIGDGTSYWVWARNRAGNGDSAWHAYDPVGDTPGEPGEPEWFGEGVRAAPEGSVLESGWLRPAPSAVPGPMCAPVDGVLGWRVVKLPDGSRRCEDLAGRSVPGPADWDRVPLHALRFPGADRTLAVVKNWYGIQLLDADGTVVAQAQQAGDPGPFATGTAPLPPVRYWHLLQPRDPQGSAALRRIDEETAAALLTGALAEGPRDAGNQEAGNQEAGKRDAGNQDSRTQDAGTQGEPRTDDQDLVSGLVRTLLPEVGHPALRTGIAGVTRFAAEQQRVLDAARARLDAAIAGGTGREPRPETRPEPGDELLEAALNGVGLTGRGTFARYTRYYSSAHDLYGLPRLLARSMRSPAEPAPQGLGHVELVRQKPLEKLDALALPELPAILALRAGSECTVEEHREALDAFLDVFDTHGLTELDPDHWRRVRLRLDRSRLQGPDAPSGTSEETVLQLAGGAFLLFPSRPYHFLKEWDSGEDPGGVRFGALLHDPSGRFEVPEPYTLIASGPFVPRPTRAPGWAAAFRATLAERGPAPWFPSAAEEFARLTGVTPTMARLVVAGLPRIDDKREAVPPATLKTIGVTSADARVAKDELMNLDAGARQAVVAALLPTEPARLWTDGPDAARAAEIWNERVGRRTPVPEEVLHDAVRTVASPGWAPSAALYGFVGMATEPRLTRDLTWRFGRYSLESAEQTPGFTNDVLKGSVALAAWLAHRLPAGDRIRAVLPGVLTALRDRLAHPGLLIHLDRRVDREAFRSTAGDPAETGEGHVRHGAVVLGTVGAETVAAIRPALLDAAGTDPHLSALSAGERPNAQETALRLVHDQAFARLLADPGDPVAGERDAEGQWWPQDPARSVPDLVGEAAERYGIGEDAAVIYLMLLAMPDPTDRNTARWTGWTQRRGGTARLRAARAELAATDLVVEGSRSKAGRSLFLPGGWTRLEIPHLPLERWKVPMYGPLEGEKPVLGVVVPTRPVAVLYREAWRRIQDGDRPQLEELEVPQPRGRRR